MDTREEKPIHAVISDVQEAASSTAPALTVPDVNVQEEMKELRRTMQEVERLRDRYRDLFDHAPVGYFLLGDDGIIQDVNQAGCAQLGQPLERLRGRRFVQYLADSSHTSFEVFLRRVFASREAQHVELQLAGRETQHVLTNAVACPSGHAKVCVQVALTDISSLKEAQRRISDLNATLEARVEARTAQIKELNSELESFVQAVTHELQEPLRQATSLAEVLRGSHNLTPEKAEHYSQVMLSRVDRMNVLLDALGTYFRLGRQRARFIPVSLERVLSDVKKELKPTLATCRVEWKQDPLPTVLGDSRTLQTIFLNLMDNALKFSRDQDPIQVRVLANETETEYQIGVQDNGVGFNMRNKEKLFDIFRRLHSDKTFEGLGLGLPMVRRAVLRHGGRCWAESREGEGSTFWVALPKNAQVNL